MKKIGIVTINDINFGNRLQCYATQIVLEKLSCNVENIFCGFKPYSGLRARIKHYLKMALLNWDEINQERTLRKFDRFNKYIHFSKFNIYEDNFADISCFYDCFFVGSDQVWNPLWKGTDIDFLCFAEKQKRNSFSASFGVESIPQEQVNRYRMYLSSFNHLSVREEAGAKIIRDLIGRDATVLVDPTMLLTKSEWRKISKRPKGVRKGYILTYFLSPKCDEATRQLENVKCSRNVYELLNVKDKVAGIVSPSEFLWLVDHADLILTDSFHACVFSFLFDKPFIVYDRNWNEGNMNSRLETLLKKFSLERKYATSGLENNIWEHDYTEGYKQLEIEREKAIQFLRGVLED